MPAASLDDFVGDVQRRLAWMPLDRFRHDPSRDRDYHVAAHWALWLLREELRTASAGQRGRES